MDSLYQIGVEIVLFVQSLGSWLEAPMRFFTFLGSENFFLLVLPTIYWSIDSRLGMRVGYILLTGTALNDLAKIALAGPRPYWLSDKVLALSSESSFGAPSGHAQQAAGIWGTIAAYLHNRWAWAAAILLILLIGLSRIYLAVHFPHDVLLGWLVGAALLWAFTTFWDRTATWLKQQSFVRQVLLAFLVSMAIILAAALLAWARSGYVLSEAWTANIMRVDDPLPEPLALSGVITSAGTLFGLSLGLAWMALRGGFQASGSPTRRSLCYLVGLAGILLFWYGLGAVLPRGEALVPYILRYLRYALVGFWITGAAPWLFFRFNFADRPKP